MSIAISKEDVELVRSFVTAKDGHEYDDLDKGIVCFDITHNYLKIRMHSVRMAISSTILDLKRKIVIHSGTPIEFQNLEIIDSNGMKIRDLLYNNATLESCGFRNGITVHCVDTNPNSLAKNGGLDDETQIEKRVMTDEEYDKRPNTVRAYKLKVDSLKIFESKTATIEFDENTVSSIHIGDRCEVNPGVRRGTVRWTGVLDASSPSKGGYWVGVVLDEPLGRNDGVYEGKRLFDCASNYGVFVRGENVIVGDFPEEDIDSDMEFYMCLFFVLLVYTDLSLLNSIKTQIMVNRHIKYIYVLHSVNTLICFRGEYLHLNRLFF